MAEKKMTDSIDFVPPNAHISSQRASPFIFEDNDAVLKIIIKSRNPTMRHVSRTQRVNLDSMLDRVNLDSGIQIKYVNTSKQIADILIMGSFRWRGGGRS